MLHIVCQCPENENLRAKLWNWLIENVGVREFLRIARTPPAVQCRSIISLAAEVNQEYDLVHLTLLKLICAMFRNGPVR